MGDALAKTVKDENALAAPKQNAEEQINLFPSVNPLAPIIDDLLSSSQKDSEKQEESKQYVLEEDGFEG